MGNRHPAPLESLRCTGIELVRPLHYSRRMIMRGYQGKEPKLGERVFIAENATIIGDVEIGDDSSIWYGTVVRGDVHFIRIGARSNVQDNCTIHVTNAAWPTM